MPRAMVSGAATRLLLEFIDHLRRLGLGQLRVEIRFRATRLLQQGRQVRGLRTGHRLVASGPLLGILDRVLGLFGKIVIRHAMLLSCVSAPDLHSPASAGALATVAVASLSSLD